MKWILKIVGGFILFALAIVLLGYVTMYLWNWLLPDLFNLPTIDFAHALGLVVLSKILFGGIRFKGSGAPWGQKRFWKAKWDSMTDEERNKFKDEFAQRCRSKWGRVEVKIEKD